MWSEMWLQLEREQHCNMIDKPALPCKEIDICFHKNLKEMSQLTVKKRINKYYNPVMNFFETQLWRTA